VSFNLVANLLVIPIFSYKGAAVVTVLSEFALLIPFYYSVRNHLGGLPWLSLFWRPTAASLIMVAVMWLLRGLPWLLLIPVGGAAYLAALALIGGFRQPDMDLLSQLLPLSRLRARGPDARTVD
jgi:O-antigen/teichoic acid export membrane protein